MLADSSPTQSVLEPAKRAKDTAQVALGLDTAMMRKAIRQKREPPGEDLVSRQQDSLSHRVVEDDDGTFAVHVVTPAGTRVVPGFPTAARAQEWITSELDRRERERDEKCRR